MLEPRQLPGSIGKYPLLVVTVAVLITILFALGIPRLEMRPFFEGDLPANDPILATNEEYTSYFGKDDIAYLAVVSDTIYRSSTLEKIVSITEELNGLDHVIEEQTLSLETVRKVKWSDDTGLDVRKYLNPMPRTPEDIERLRQDVRSDRDIYGRIVSKDETATLLAVKLNAGYDRTRLYNSLHAIAQKYSGPEVIYPFGRQVMSEEANMGIAHDGRTLGPAALALMAVGIFMFFRSIRLTLASVFMVATSIIWAMGIMFCLGFRLSMLSPSIPAVLIALGSSYMIHVIYSCSEGAGKAEQKKGIMEGAGRMVYPIGLAAFTSMVGFATLVVFKMLSIREFGLSVALGVGFAASLALLALPAIIILLRKGFSSDGPRKFLILDKLLIVFSRIGLRYRYVVLAVATLVIIFSIIGVSKIKVGAAPEEIFPKNHRARKVVAVFIDKFQGPYSLNVMFSAREPDGLKSPDVLKQVDAFQEFAEELPKITHASSIVNIIKKMNQILNEDDPELYKVPDSEEMIAQTMLLHSITRDPAQFESLVDYDVQRCKVVVATTAIDSMELEALYKQLARYCEENITDDVIVNFGGHGLIWVAQNDYIIVGKIINITVNTILIWIICALAFRSVRLGLIGIIPLSLATLTTFGLMGHLGIRLDTATAVLTGISVGVGVDFAIHFITRMRRESIVTQRMDEVVEAAMLGAGRAIVFDAISNVLGFSVFILSGFSPVRSLGLLICFTMISCVLLTLILVPAIMAIIPIPLRRNGQKTIFLDARSESDEQAKGSSAPAD